MLSKQLITAVAVLAGALGLAACGSEGGGLESGSGDDVEIQTAQGGDASGELTISNWPLYIDKNTVANFEEETGVSVKYIEDINDNTEFFGKLRPQLAQGESGGRSIIVPTDWMAAKMYDLGYVQNLDKSAIPNVEENLISSLESPSFDPERNFSVPWQSGMTGIIVRKDLAPDITSINDLFDPKYEGKVTFLSEMPDTVPLVMKADGVDPENASDEDWLAAIDKIQRGRRRPGRSATSPATTTPMTCLAATSSRRSAGRATRSSSRPTTRTSSGGCPTRAACSGRTTWRSRSGRRTRRPRWLS